MLPPGSVPVWLVVALAMTLVDAGAPAQAPAGSRRDAHVITGVVRAPDGRPVPDTFVTALVRDDPIEVIRGPGWEDRPYRFVSARLGAVTDASGRYSLELPYAGEFYLAALPRQVRGPGRREGYGNTFYPRRHVFSKPSPSASGPARRSPRT